MKVIGLTGGIGSGKSTVARIFTSLGVPVFDADKAGRDLLSDDPGVIDGVRRLFGDKVMVDDKPDRNAIARVVFRDEDTLHQLNAIIHPAVARLTEVWKTTYKDHPYGIKEAAILFESGAYKDCDDVIGVRAEEEERIRRVMHRDGVDEQHVRERMARQWPQEKVAEKSRFVISNDGVESLINQVLSIHDQLL